MSESLSIIDDDNQKKLDKVLSNKNFDESLDENGDVTKLIEELSDEINLESIYKDNLNELKEKKEQDFSELERRYNQLKEFKISNVQSQETNKNNKRITTVDDLGPPPKPIVLSEFGLNEEDPDTWCCKYHDK